MKLGRESLLLIVIPFALLIGVALLWLPEARVTGPETVPLKSSTRNPAVLTGVPQGAPGSEVLGVGVVPSGIPETAIPSTASPGHVHGRSSSEATSPTSGRNLSSWLDKRPTGGVQDTSDRKTVTSRVLDRDGKPIPGAVILVRERLNLFDRMGRPFDDSRASLETLHANLEGDVRFTERPGRTYEIHVSAQGYAPLVRNLVGASSGKPVSLILQQPSRVRGTVRHASTGLAIEGVIVSVMAGGGTRTSVTDMNGRYLVDELQPGAAFLAASHGSFMPERVLLGLLGEGETVTRDLVLKPGVPVVGIVRNRSGVTVADATVRATIEYRRELVMDVRSDLSGRFSAESFATGITYRFHAEHPSYGATSKTVTVPAEGQLIQVELELSDPWDLEGIVLGDSDEAIEGARVAVFAVSGAAASTLEEVFTDGRGFFLVKGLSDQNDYDVSIWRAGFVPVLVHVKGSPPPGGARDPLMIRLERGSLVSGRVISADGNVVAGAYLRTERIDSGPQGNVEQFYTFSNADGTFSMDHVPSGTVKIVAIAAGFEESFVTVEVASGESLTGIELLVNRRQDLILPGPPND